MNCVKRIIKSPIFYVFYMILIVVILGSIEYSFKKSDIDKYMKEKDNQILKTEDSVLLEENDDIELDEPFTLPANLKKIDNISIEIVDNKLKVEVIETLPLTVENVIAKIHDNKLYFGIGSINGSNNNELYAYDLATKKFEVFSEFPGKLRNQAVSYVYNNELYVYGGGASETYKDGYKVNLETKEWTQLADVVIDNEEVSLLGADWAPLNDHELLVIGGFNKNVWKDAVFNLTTLQGEDHAKYRDAYFRRPVSDYKWNKKELVYNLNENRWYQLEEIPFEAPCGHALLATVNNIYSIMGEIKPAERKPYIHRTKK